MDPRMKVALFALKKLEDLERSGRLRGDLEPIKHKLKSLEWIDDIEYLRTESKSMVKLDSSKFRYDERQKMLVKWCFEAINKLPEKFMRDGSNSILLGLDCALGEILSVRKLEHGLTVCRITSKLGKLTIITNMKVKKGEKLFFCILPPAEFQDIISEAMFVSGPINSLNEVNWKAIEGKVSEVLMS